jgi:hypothetical protein
MSRLRGLWWSEYEITGLADSAKADTAMEFSDEHFAYDFLARLARDRLNLPKLRALAADLGRGFSSYNTGDSDLLRFLAARLVSRRIRVVGLKIERVVVDSNVPDEVESKAPVEAPKPQEARKTWIKFQVLHDDTGLPVSDVQLTIRYPDGTSKEHWIRESGLVELTGIPSGAYAIERAVHSDTFEVIPRP